MIINKLRYNSNNNILKTIINNNSIYYNNYSNNNNNNLYYSTKRSKKPILLGYEQYTSTQQQQLAQQQQDKQIQKKRIRNRTKDKKKLKDEFEQLNSGQDKEEEIVDDGDNGNQYEKSVDKKYNPEISNIQKNKNFGNGGGILSKYAASNFIKNNWMKRHLTDEYVKEARALSLVSRAAFKLININKQLGLLKPKMVVVDLGASPGSWTQVAKSEVTDEGLVISVDINDKFQLTSKFAFVQGDFTLKETQGKILELIRYKNAKQLQDALELKRQKQLERDLLEYSKKNKIDNNNNNNIYNNDDNIDEIIEDEDNNSNNINNNNNSNNRLVDVILSDMAPHYSGIPKVDHSRLIDLQTSALNFALKVLKPGGSFVCKVSRGGEEREFFKLLEKDFISVKTMKPDASRLESSEIYYIAKGFLVPKSNQ